MYPSHTHVPWKQYTHFLGYKLILTVCDCEAAKISTHETSQLGSKKQYMSKLLSLVRNKMETRTVDITMKFTLSALWNLTGKLTNKKVLLCTQLDYSIFLVNVIV